VSTNRGSVGGSAGQHAIAPGRLTIGGWLSSLNSMKSSVFFVAGISLICALLTGCNKPPEPPETAETRFQKTRIQAEHGNANAQAELGFSYIEGRGVIKDYIEAVKWLRKAADQNHPQAQYNLGAAYISGTGVAQDEAEAIRWLQKAADQNVAEAQHDLGVLCIQGKGMPKDEPKAAELFRKSAEQNNVGAQIKLGFVYASGTGTAKDTVQAHAWWTVALASGDMSAKDVIVQLEKEMKPEQIQQAAVLAAQLSAKLHKK